jgi:phosphorylcholine metabolism protein LicD
MLNTLEAGNCQVEITIKKSKLFFTSKILPNFDLKNMISTMQSIFHAKKWPKFAKFQIIVFSNCHILMTSSSSSCWNWSRDDFKSLQASTKQEILESQETLQYLVCSQI